MSNNTIPTQQVAEAIRQGYLNGDRAPLWEELPESSRRHWLRMAQAAIDALQLTEERQEGGIRWAVHRRLVGPWVEGER